MWIKLKHKRIVPIWTGAQILSAGTATGSSDASAATTYQVITNPLTYSSLGVTNSFANVFGISLDTITSNSTAGAYGTSDSSIVGSASIAFPSAGSAAGFALTSMIGSGAIQFTSVASTSEVSLVNAIGSTLSALMSTAAGSGNSATSIISYVLANSGKSVGTAAGINNAVMTGTYNTQVNSAGAAFGSSASLMLGSGPITYRSVGSAGGVASSGFIGSGSITYKSTAASAGNSSTHVASSMTATYKAAGITSGLSSASGVSSLSTTTDIFNAVFADMGTAEQSVYNPTTTPFTHANAVVVMGSRANGDGTPWWWVPNDTTLKDSVFWNAASPWFVIYPAINNTATNTRIKIGRVKILYLSKATNHWVDVSPVNPNPTWGENRTFNISGVVSNANVRVSPDGWSFKLTTAQNPIHGGVGKVAIPGSDILALYASMDSNLEVDNLALPNDTANAQIMLQIGVDYYKGINDTLAMYAPAALPGAMGGRLKLSHVIKQSHYAVTLNPPGSGGKISNYKIAGGVTDITQTQFIANPPPF